MTSVGLDQAPAPGSENPGSDDIEGRDIEKSFGHVRALRGVTLAIGAGEARGLVGENGAGKSTLINVLTGALQPDRGTVTVRGTATVLKNPRAALALGIATVHQQNRLVPSLTVLENVELGHEPTATPLRWLSRKPRLAAIAALDFVGMSKRASSVVGSLSLADRQLVSIARAVSRSSRLLIFDEPTAALSPIEARYLFEVVDQLRSVGTSLLYVTHRLEELPRVVDRVTVMRDGRVVATRATGVPERELVELMAGDGTVEHDVALVAERRRATAGQRNAQTPLLAVKRLDDRDGAFSDVSFDVAHGEIVGLVGLPDSGAIEVIQVLAGARRAAGGTVSIDETEAHYASPRAALRQGVGYLAGDRAQKGVLPNFSVRDTITLSSLPRTARAGLLRLGHEAELSQRLMADCQVRAASSRLPMTALSGGNQQKALFARLLAAEPQLIICEDATSGVDVAGRESIYDLVTAWCEQGNAAVWNSSDLRELATICDRVIVLRDGKVVASVPNADLSVDRLMAAQFHDPIENDASAFPAPNTSPVAGGADSASEHRSALQPRGEQ